MSEIGSVLGGLGSALGSIIGGSSASDAAESIANQQAATAQQALAFAKQQYADALKFGAPYRAAGEQMLPYNLAMAKVGAGLVPAYMELITGAPRETWMQQMNAQNAYGQAPTATATTATPSTTAAAQSYAERPWQLNIAQIARAVKEAEGAKQWGINEGIPDWVTPTDEWRTGTTVGQAATINPNQAMSLQTAAALKSGLTGGIPGPSTGTTTETPYGIDPAFFAPSISLTETPLEKYQAEQTIKKLNRALAGQGLTSSGRGVYLTGEAVRPIYAQGAENKKSDVYRAMGFLTGQSPLPYGASASTTAAGNAMQTANLGANTLMSGAQQSIMPGLYAAGTKGTMYSKLGGLIGGIGSKIGGGGGGGTSTPYDPYASYEWDYTGYPGQQETWYGAGMGFAEGGTPPVGIPSLVGEEGPEMFVPEGTGYDILSALKYGLSPDATGHWPSRVPSTGLLLKGTNHPTWNLTVEGERQAGYEIYKGKDGRYYSRPIQGVSPEYRPIPYDENEAIRENMQWMLPLSGRQLGGPVSSDQPYTVGESGPEVFVPNQPGTIVPNPATTLRQMYAQNNMDILMSEESWAEKLKQRLAELDRVGSLTPELIKERDTIDNALLKATKRLTVLREMGRRR
jgi:hypothetical protein